MDTPPKRRKIDPLHYAAFCRDDETAEAIEYRFALLDQRIKESTGADAEDVARQTYMEYCTPQEIPLDIWFSFETKDQLTTRDEDDDAFVPGNEDIDDDEFVSRVLPRAAVPRQKRRRGVPRRRGMSAAAQIEHVGAGIDLWPCFKVDQVCRSGGVVLHREFPNRAHVRQRAGILREFSQSDYHAVPQITPAVFRELVGDTCDCMIVDPPFGHGGWTHNRFRDFIVSLKHTIHHCFIVCWLDPDDIAPVIDIFHNEKFVFCDSIVVELLDGFNRPLTLYSDKCGLPRNSRMAVMFRTNDITRSDLRQQRVKDTGYGIVDPVGKTYGRPSTPKTAHTIIEVMLPPKKTGPRIFVELWPNFFHRRKNWILIDEIEKKKPAEG